MDSATDTVALKKAVKSLRGACQQLCASLLPPHYTVINSAVPFEWACMRVVVRAKVADVLENHLDGLHIDELARLVDLEKGKLARVLRFLVSKGCFTEVEPNVFANNRVSLITISSSASGALVRHMSQDMSDGAAVLYEAMTEPEYATSYHPEKSPLMYALNKKGIKGNYFDWLKEDTERRETFQRAQIGTSMGSLSVLQHYPWNEVKTMCDVGAGIGTVSRPLARMHPHLEITHQDLPEVMIQAKDSWANDAAEVLQNNRVDFVPLDFLEQSPVPGQDVYYLRHIIDDWPDAEAAIILGNVRKAMDSHSRMLLHNSVIPPTVCDSTATSFGLHAAPEQLLPSIESRVLQQDLGMWFIYNAKQRTLHDFIALGSAVGLQLEKVYDLAESAVMEFKLTK